MDSTTAALPPSLYQQLRAVPRRKPLQPTAQPAPEPPVAAVGDASLAGDGNDDVKLLSWRPFYLQRRVLAVFGFVFIAEIIVLEVLLAASSRNGGLASSTSDLHYLWTFGPTAVMTLVAHLWSRVEFQTKSAAPWIRLSRGLADVNRTLLLDYISTWQPKVIPQALRNHDFGVASATAVSLIFNLLVIVSTGLFTLVPTTTDFSVPVNITSAFVNSPDGLASTGSLSWFSMWGLINDGLHFPDGISSQYAYQTVSSDLPPSGLLEATVDGFMADLECETATMKLVNVTLPDPHLGQMSMNVTVESAGCSMNISLPAPSYHSPDQGPKYFAVFEPVSCSAVSHLPSLDDMCVILSYGIMNYTQGAEIDDPAAHGWKTHIQIGEILNSTQLVCKPVYAINRVDIIQNATDLLSLSISATDSNHRTLSSVHPWRIMEAHFESYSNSISITGGGSGVSPTAYINSTEIDTDRQSNLIISFSMSSLSHAADMLDSKRLQGVARRYYQQYAAFIAHRSLMQLASDPSTGSASVVEDRLLVQNLAAQLMTGLLALSLPLLLITAWFAPPDGILPRKATSIVGTAAVLSSSISLLRSLQGLGGSGHDAIRLRIGNSFFRSWVAIARQKIEGGVGMEAAEFQVLSGLGTVLAPPGDDTTATQIKAHSGSGRNVQPMVLRWQSRLSACAVLAGLIAALEVTLRKSQLDDGLGDVFAESYLHFLWTISPAIVLGLLALYLAAVDFQTRVQAPYANLLHRATFNASVRLDLVDGIIPVVLAREIRTRSLTPLATTLAFLVSSAFTILSGSLFLAQSLPTTTSARLNAVTSFNYVVSSGDSESAIVSSLILESNLSYPAFTSNDLAFPHYTLDLGNGSITSNNTATVSTATSPSSSGLPESSASLPQLTISATIPGLRPRLDCKRYGASAANWSIYADGTKVQYTRNPLVIDFMTERCSLFDHNVVLNLGDLVHPDSDSRSSPNASTIFFGLSSGTPATMQQLTACSGYLYVWGSLNVSSLHSSTSNSSFSSASTPRVASLSALACNETIEQVSTDVTFLSLPAGLQFDPSSPPPSPRENTARAANITVAHDRYIYNLVNISNPPHLLDEFFSVLSSSRFALPLDALTDPGRENDVVDAILKQHGVVRAQTLSLSYRLQNLSAPDSEPVVSVMPVTAVVTDPSGRRRVVQGIPATRALQVLLGTALLLLILGWGLAVATPIWGRRSSGRRVIWPVAEINSLAGVAATVAGGNLQDYLPPGAEWMDDGELRKWFPPGAKFWMGWQDIYNDRVPNAREIGGTRAKFGVWVVGEGTGAMERDSLDLAGELG